MGCHSQATFLGSKGSKKAGVDMFMADQYVPRDAPWFISRLQTDFSWSLAGPFEQDACSFEDDPEACQKLYEEREREQ